MHCLRVLAVVLLCATTANAQLVFHIDTVDDDGDVGHRASLALDSQGRPHISYSEVGIQPPGELLYITKSGNTWAKETVYRYGGERFGHNLVVMPGDVPAVSAGGVFRIRTAPSVWSEETMGGGFSPWYSIAAVDNFGQIHGVSQWSWGTGIYSGFVDYLQRSGAGTWTDTPLNDAIFIPFDPIASMAFDAQNDPHIAMTTNYGDFLQYHVSDNGFWSTDTIAVGAYGSIQIDHQSNGWPRISYYDTATQDLVMAYWLGNAWATLPVDVAGDVGAYSSHAIHNGVSHVAYYHRDLGDLRYAQVSLGAAPIITAVDSEGDVGEYASLAVDADGHVHIAYHDRTNGALKYAVQRESVATEQSTAGRVKYIFRQ